MTFDPQAAFFDFEQDFAGSLRCIPMRVRLRLDLCAIKLTLRQWSQFTPAQRKALLDTPFDTAEQRSRYAEALKILIAAACDEPLKLLTKNEEALWQDARCVPDCVLEQARHDDIAPPTLAQWGGLHELQRFALVKLARSKHENENFVPALREFGLTAPTPSRRDRLN
ncbi:nitrate reductase associated protein [Asaia sp. VD9]|uniref:nitrate reductase associated protein n=1 Tax=Asaia sp. VD9 TaxID=3081235 RepID=UPI0030170085